MTGSAHKDPIQLKIEQGENISLTEYWQAILELVARMKQQEAEFSKVELEKDQGYHTALEALQKMATAGVKLEETGIFYLQSVGNAVKAARASFNNSDQIPEITGKASRQLAKDYLDLLKHFQEMKVFSTGMLQRGLKSQMPGETKSGYQDAKDSALALEKAIKAFDEKRQQTPSANARIAESDEDILARNEDAIRNKFIQAHHSWTLFNKAYLKYQALISAMQWKEFSKLKELPILNKSGLHNVHKLHEELDQFLRNPLIKHLPNETKLPSKEELRHKIHKKLPREKSAQEYYKLIAPLLSKENSERWNKRYKKSNWSAYLSSFSDKRAQEKIDFDALVDVLTEELTSAATKTHEQAKIIARSHTRHEIKVIREIQHKQRLLKQLSAKVKKMDSLELKQAIENFANTQSNNPTLLFNVTKLIDSLDRLCPTKKMVLSKSLNKMKENIEQSSSQQAVCHIREITYKAACEEVILALQNPDISTKKISGLNKIVSFAYHAIRPHHNEIEQRSLENKVKEIFGKPSIGKKFLGALMIAAGYIAKNPKLYEKGWATFQSGYDAGKHYLGAALGWLSTSVPVKEQKKSHRRSLKL